MERATTWSVANDGDFQMIQEALDSSQIYQENNVEVRVFTTSSLTLSRICFTDTGDANDGILAREIFPGQF
jgi:hypothetical protein